MNIKRNGSQASIKGSADTSTGSVRIAWHLMRGLCVTTGLAAPRAFLFSALLSAPTLAQSPTGGTKIEVVSPLARTVIQGVSEHFTGHVQVEQLFAAQAGRHLSGGRVSFEPGARSAWHTHPAGQILIITAGTGLVQRWGDPVQTIKAGDVVWIPPGVKHWHGATPTSSLTHLAIQETVDEKAVDWEEPVSDAQYPTGAAVGTHAERNSSRSLFGGPMLTESDVRSVSPALAAYTQDKLLGDLWKRPELSRRDRSIVTVAALIARNQTVQMAYYFNLALDNGVKPGEVSEIIAHLAFYSGWENAMSAVVIAKDVFRERGIGPDLLPPVSAKLLPLNEAAEKQRASTVEQNFGAVAPGVVEYTTELLFRDLWLRPALAPRDRSLVTVSALIASGQVAQVSYHLNRAMDNGLTERQASEVLTHLAFYAGWPKVFSALPAVKEIFEKRAK
jgi:4-carboxymuconolactone decarboxylase